MRFVVIFSLFLCVFLSGMYDHVHFDAHQNRISYSAAHNIENTQEAKFTYANKDLYVTNNTSLGKEDEHFVVNEYEEEDHVSARKYVLLVRYLTTHFLTSNFNNSLIIFKESLPFCTHLSYSSSYKYITQRVLRIWSTINISSRSCDQTHRADGYWFIPIFPVILFHLHTGYW